MQAKQVKRIADVEARKEVKMQRMHPGQKPTFKAGGVTSLEMKKYGRNVARAMNQRSATKPRGV
jgi:hypothetical protein